MENGHAPAVQADLAGFGSTLMDLLGATALHTDHETNIEASEGRGASPPGYLLNSTMWLQSKFLFPSFWQRGIKIAVGTPIATPPISFNLDKSD
jgi:hypothetical protein